MTAATTAKAATLPRAGVPVGAVADGPARPDRRGRRPGKEAPL